MPAPKLHTPGNRIDWFCPYPHERGGTRQRDDPPCLCLQGATWLDRHPEAFGAAVYFLVAVLLMLRAFGVLPLAQ